MRYLIILCFIGLYAQAADNTKCKCEKPPCAEVLDKTNLNTILQIQKLIKVKQPAMTPQQVEQLSIKINQAALARGLCPYLVAGIVALESEFKINAVNRKSKDYGLMQINKYNIKARGLNKARLLKDADYNLKFGTTILAEFKARYDSDWICRFNIGTTRVPTKKQIKKCATYTRLVMHNAFFAYR